MIKKTIKRAGRKTLIVSKRVAVKIPVIRQTGVKVKAVLFPELANLAREVYTYQAYYPSIQDYLRQREESKQFKEQPLISLIIPTYNTPKKYLRECIDSILLQSYANWELCIADDASPDKAVVKVLKEYASHDKRIKIVVRKANGHISKASNSALELATGPFVALVDHDDVLWPNALFEVASAINKNPEVDLIYSDEDKIDKNSKYHSYPFFKPDWSPEFLESCNYITHFACIRTAVIREMGGFRPGYEGAQDWDLFMRIGEQTSRIVHIPKLLYSWRIHEASTAHDTDSKPYVYEAQRKLLEDHVARQKVGARVRTGIIKQHSTIDYAVTGSPKVAVLVYGESTDLIRRAISSLAKKPGYTNMEIIILSHRKQAKARAGIRFMQLPGDVKGAAAAYNYGAEQTKSNFLLFANEKLQAISDNWLTLLLGDAQRQNTGVVGTKLLDKSKKYIRHAGIALGIQGLYVNLLDGTRDDDQHYTRGLYANSRRNVSAVNGTCMLVSRRFFDLVGGFDSKAGATYDVDFCLSVHKAGGRNIYTPHVQVVDITDRKKLIPTKEEKELFKLRWRKQIKADPYYNPNFTSKSSKMEAAK